MRGHQISVVPIGLWLITVVTTLAYVAHEGWDAGNGVTFFGVRVIQGFFAALVLWLAIAAWPATLARFGIPARLPLVSLALSLWATMTLVALIWGEQILKGVQAIGMLALFLGIGAWLIGLAWSAIGRSVRSASKTASQADSAAVPSIHEDDASPPQPAERKDRSSG